MTKHVGMTGTRNGMTDKQKATFKRLLLQLEADWLHHGDCVGADAESHGIAECIGVRTHIHPPVKDELRAYCKGTKSENKKGYFQRNRDIVNSSDVLIGTPATVEETKGGTWYTINYSKGKDKPTYVIYPDGSFDAHFVVIGCEWR